MEQELVQEEKVLEFHPKTSITIISSCRVVNIAIANITHVSRFGYEVVIYTADNNFRTYKSLNEIMKDLPVNDFFRVHQSHIVCLRHMAGVRNGKLIVGEYYVPMSKNYKVELQTRLGEILDKKYFFMETSPGLKATPSKGGQNLVVYESML